MPLKKSKEIQLSPKTDIYSDDEDLEPIDGDEVETTDNIVSPYDDLDIDDDDPDTDIAEDEEEDGSEDEEDERALVKIEPITFSEITRPINPSLPKNYYFDNNYVEKLLTEYVKGGCTNIKLRDEIMSNAEELIKQIIRTHKLHLITNGKEGTAFGDLYQLAWVQIESSLYKFDYRPGHTKVFNMWCVAPDTMLFTDKGILPIGNMLYKGQGLDHKVYGLNGFRPLMATLCRPKSHTRKIKTLYDYSLECTPEHRIYTIRSNEPQWVESGDLKVGDYIGIQYNQQAFANNDKIDINLSRKGRHKWTPPSEWNRDLAYVIGLYVAEGSHSKNQLDIYNVDASIVDTLVNNSLGLRFKSYPKNQSIVLCNTRFNEFIDKLGLTSDVHADRKFIPQAIMGASKPIILSFLSGLFDGDGGSSRHNGQISFSSTSVYLINQVRSLLLNLGIISKLSIDTRSCSEFNGQIFQKKTLYQLVLSSHDSKVFYNTIAFSESRKQDKQSKLPSTKVRIYGVIEQFKKLYSKYGPGGLGYNSIRPLVKADISSYLALTNARRYLQSWNQWCDDPDYLFISNRINERMTDGTRIIWVPIKSITESESPVCEITVDSPDHSYISNGIISHNSQVAKTVMLAHIKKESRDKRNYGAYKEHLDGRHRPASYKFQRFLEEAREVCKHHTSYSKVLDAIEWLFEYDPRPYDGLIDKLVRRSGLTRTKVSSFLRMIRLRSYEFTDAPLSEELPQQDHNKYRVIHTNYDADED